MVSLPLLRWHGVRCRDASLKHALIFTYKNSALYPSRIFVSCVTLSQHMKTKPVTLCRRSCSAVATLPLPPRRCHSDVATLPPPPPHLAAVPRRSATATPCRDAMPVPPPCRLPRATIVSSRPMSPRRRRVEPAPLRRCAAAIPLPRSHL